MNDSEAKKRSVRFYWGGVFLLLAGFAALTYYTFRGTCWFPRGDMGEYLTRSITAYRFLKAGDFTRFFWQDTFYPPLVFQTSALQYLFLPHGLLCGVMSQWPFWAVLAFSLYGLGSWLFGPLTGLLAVFYCFTSPLTLLFSYQYMLDIPAAAFLVGAVYLLLKSEDFRDRSASLWLGPVLGLGMLVKWWTGYLLLGGLLLSLWGAGKRYFKNWLWAGAALGVTAFGLYGFLRLAEVFRPGLQVDDPYGLGGYFLLTLGEAALLWGALYALFRLAERFWGADPGERGGMVNCLTAFCLAFAFCAWLYLNPWFSFLNGSLYRGGAFGLKLSLGQLLFYPRRLGKFILSPGYLTFLLIGTAVWAVKFRREAPQRRFIWILLSAGLLAALPCNQQDRYFLPWVALASPLAVFWIEDLKKGKIPVIAALGLLGVLSALCGWALPGELYRRNLCLSLLTCRGNLLAQRREPIKVGEDFFQALFGPLPKKGEKVLVLGPFPQPLGENVIRLYPYLYDAEVVVKEQERLGDYQYIIYPRALGEEDSGLYRRLMAVKHGRYRDAGDYDFKLLSRYRFAGEDFEVCLSRMSKKDEPKQNQPRH